MAMPARKLIEKRPRSHQGRPLPRAFRRRRRATPKQLRITLFAAIPLALVLAYVGMTAELTAQTYRLSAGQIRQAELLQTTGTLRQRLTQAQSLSRLERAAAQLHMSEPHRVVIIAVPVVAQAKRPITFAGRLESLAKWFKRQSE